MSGNPIFDQIEQQLSGAFGKELVNRVNGTIFVGVDHYAVTLSDMGEERGLLVFTVLGELSMNDADRLAQCQLLLKANTFFFKTAGFTLSYQEESGVILQALIPWSRLSEPGSILGLLQNLVDVGDYWTGQCDLIGNTVRDDSDSEVPTVDQLV